MPHCRKTGGKRQYGSGDEEQAPHRSGNDLVQPPDHRLGRNAVGKLGDEMAKTANAMHAIASREYVVRYRGTCCLDLAASPGYSASSLVALYVHVWLPRVWTALFREGLSVRLSPGTEYSAVSVSNRMDREPRPLKPIVLVTPA